MDILARILPPPLLPLPRTTFLSQVIPEVWILATLNHPTLVWSASLMPLQERAGSRRKKAFRMIQAEEVVVSTNCWN